MPEVLDVILDEVTALAEAGRVLSAKNEADLVRARDLVHGVIGKNMPMKSTEALSEADQSYPARYQAISDALRAVLPTKTVEVPVGGCYIRDVFDTYVIYEQYDGEDCDLFQRDYTVAADGTVTLGDPISVEVVVTYQPAPDTDDDEMSEAVDANVGGGVDRDKIPAADFAGPDRSYPIVIPKDVSDAADSLGRLKGGKATPAERAAVKAKIIAIAKRKGATFAAELPKAWQESGVPAPADDPATESAAVMIEGNLIPLQESAVRPDGTMTLKIISPGWGSKGYYGADMIKAYGPKVFTAGVHNHLDHPTLSEARDRPERTIRDIASVLTTDSRWEDNGPDGPGLYAEAEVIEPYRPLMAALAPHIGVSIRTEGRYRDGEAEGRKGRIITSLEATPGRSVDYVTVPGRGGKVIQLMESARAAGQTPFPSSTEDHPTPKEDLPMAEPQQHTTDATEATGERDVFAEMGQMRAALDRLSAENERLREKEQLREAADVIARGLDRYGLPARTRTRLMRELQARVPLTEAGAIDREGFATLIKESAVEAMSELESAGAGAIRGMGASQPTDEITVEGASKSLTESMAMLMGGR